MALRPLRSIDLHRCPKLHANYTGRINGYPCIATVLKPLYGTFTISCHFKPVKCDVKEEEFRCRASHKFSTKLVSVLHSNYTEEQIYRLCVREAHHQKSHSVSFHLTISKIHKTKQKPNKHSYLHIINTDYTRFHRCTILHI